MENVKMKIKVGYNGYNVKKNGDVDLTFLASAEELPNVLQLCSLLGRNVTVKAKVTDKPFGLGIFLINMIHIDREGESKIKFNTEIDSSEIVNFPELIQRDRLIDLMCIASIEKDDSDE